MFRVLSEEEAKKVTRWQAPDLSGLPRQAPGKQTTAADLQAAHPLDMDVPEPVKIPPTTTTVPLPNLSADMLQASYDEGFTRGYAEGNAALHQQSVKQLNTVISALSQAALVNDDSSLEHEIIELALGIARLLMHREIQMDPQVMGQLVHAAIQQLPSASESRRRVRLHPLDAKVVREVIPETENVVIVDDPSLPAGSCLVEAGSSMVRAGIEDWLENMAAQLGIPQSHNRTLTE